MSNDEGRKSKEDNKVKRNQLRRRKKEEKWKKNQRRYNGRGKKKY